MSSVEPTVSVIIPTWNRRATIVAAVASALNQTCPPLEVLVCDNGSTDDSEALIRAMGDARVRWLTGPAGGRPAFPRNRGIAAAAGEWLAFLDSDDEWLPDKLASQLAAVSASGRRACSTNAWRFVPGVGRQGTMLDVNEAALDLGALLHGNRVICSSALVHRSLMPEAEGFPEAERLTALEDYALWLRVACFTAFDYLPQPHVLYRDDPPNSLRVRDIDPWSQRVAVLRDFLAWCRRHRSAQTRQGSRAGRHQMRIEKRREPRRLARRAWIRRRVADVLAAVGLRRRPQC
jgi:glycosyltransferase involved in cell wall biosynthesis